MIEILQGMEGFVLKDWIFDSELALWGVVVVLCVRHMGWAVWASGIIGRFRFVVGCLENTYLYGCFAWSMM